jgi:serine/threonine protein kinase
MNSDPANDYTFEIEGGRKFSFELVNGKPVKLGDGSYGAVFLVQDPNDGKRYAVKLLYKIFGEKEDPAQKQFLQEMGISKKLREGTGENKPPHIVNIIGGTDQFRNAVSKELESAFNIRVSKFAEVMDLYSYTLKDLLERGPITSKPWEEPVPKRKAQYVVSLDALENAGLDKNSGLFNLVKDSYEELEGIIEEKELLSDDVKGVLKKGIVNRIGYELLRSMSFIDRISTIWKILRDVTEGLEAVHESKEGDVAHLDIKPANIFIDASGREMQASIGDFGFTGIASVFEETHKTNIEETLPLGTLHYRSPEQKDYRDVCYVKVIHHDGRVILEVRDPKFKGSIIEKEDFVIFSKDSERLSHKIDAIEPGTEKEPTKIILKTVKHKISEDDYTQVWLYKRQDDRTDIFGIGAVAYDLLTCGKSPERFYENIRRYEKTDRGEPGSVADVIEKYVQVSEYKSTEPGLASIFEPLKDPRTSEYPPKWFVEWIVKCMLYQAEGTFYDLSRRKDSLSKNPFTLIMKDLHSFTESPVEASEERLIQPRTTNNPLITLEHPGNQKGEANTLSTKIDELQNRDNIDYRLVQGIYYSLQLVRLLKSKFAADARDEDRFFFFELLPQNIIVMDRATSDREFRVSNHVFKDREAYEKDLQDDEVYKRIVQDVLNPFVPARITYVRRRVRLIKHTNADVGFKYSFLDSSQLNEPIKEGDWIVASGKLYKIVAHNQQDHYIELIKESVEKVGIMNDSSHPDLHDIQGGEYVFYQDLDRRKYYLEMLSLYLYNLIFAENEHVHSTRSKIHASELKLAGNYTIRTYNLNLPDKVFSHQIIPSISAADEYRKYYGNLVKYAPQRLDLIYKSTAHILTKLIFHNDPQSYYMRVAHRGGEKDFTEELAGIILDDLDELRSAIEICFGFAPRQLEKLKEPNGSITEDIKKQISKKYDWHYTTLITSCLKDKSIFS